MEFQGNDAELAKRYYNSWRWWAIRFRQPWCQSVVCLTFYLAVTAGLTHLPPTEDLRTYLFVFGLVMSILLIPIFWQSLRTVGRGRRLQHLYPAVESNHRNTALTTIFTIVLFSFLWEFYWWPQLHRPAIQMSYVETAPVCSLLTLEMS